MCMAMLERDGVIEKIGADHVYGNVYEACKDLIPADSRDS